jgi:membrane-associated phospholipid phosphatase
MPFVLNDLSRPLKAFVALALIICSPASVVGAELARPSLEPRNFLKATLADARLPGGDWSLMVLPAAGLFTLVLADPQLYPRLRGKQDWLEASMPVATQFGEGLYAALGSAALWGLGAASDSPRLVRSSSTALESMAYCAVASTGLKYAFNANRPSDRDDRHDFFTAGISGTPSFPSGHSMVAFALAEVYGDAYGRYWTYPLAAVVGYSRIYLGAHWPSDVVAGALVGAGLGHICVAAARDKGAPASWRFSALPAEGGMVLAASRQFR